MGSCIYTLVFKCKKHLMNSFLQNTNIHDIHKQHMYISQTYHKHIPHNHTHTNPTNTCTFHKVHQSLRHNIQNTH